jgi:lysophospholipid acyltransferase
MNTNVWLRECIYKRVAKKGKKPGLVPSPPSLLPWTFTKSAPSSTASRALKSPSSPLLCASFRPSRPSSPTNLPPSFHSWHGVNPCFCQALNRSLRAGLRPFFLPPGALSTPNPAVATSTAPKVMIDKSATATPRVKMAAPPQTPIKRFYDFLGTLATLVVLVRLLLLLLPRTTPAHSPYSAELYRRSLPPP